MAVTQTVAEAVSTSGDNHAKDSGGLDAKRVVLIVDDDAALRSLVRIILRSADYEVATARNGIDALDVSSHLHLDLIVLDLRMPELDGPGFFQRLRERGDRTPVLLASSFGAREAQLELGAEGAIEKPFDPDELLAMVGSLIR